MICLSCIVYLGDTQNYNPYQYCMVQYDLWLYLDLLFARFITITTTIYHPHDCYLNCHCFTMFYCNYNYQ